MYIQFAVPLGGCPCSQATSRGQAGFAVACGYPLADAGGAGLDSHSRIVAAQKRLDAHGAVGTPDAGAIVESSSRAYFDDVRTLAALLLRIAGPDDLGDLPEDVLSTFERFAVDRDASLALGQRRRYISVAPTQVAVAAAASTLAVELLDAPNDQARKRLQPLAYRLPGPSRSAEHYGKRYGLSDRVAGMVSDCFTRSHARLWERPDRTVQPVTFGPEHIPQMLWREAWTELFAARLSARRQMPLRLTLSLLLVKTCFQDGWHETALSIGLGPHAGRCASTNMSQLRKAFGAEELQRRVDRLIGFVESATVRIDYLARARQFAELGLIPDEDWQTLCRQAGVAPGTGAKQRNASAYIWGELTGRPLHKAPVYGGRYLDAHMGGPELDFWTTYGRFQHQYLPPLRESLGEYAALTLAKSTAGLPLEDAPRLVRPISAAELRSSWSSQSLWRAAR
jgi:hypothetical protein